MSGLGGDPRTSQRYMPRFELWMNVFLHQAFMNCINSLSTLELTSRNIPGAGLMLTEARIPFDRLVWNVKLLDALLVDEWKETESGIANFKDMVKNVDIEKRPDLYFHQIVQLFHKRRMLRFKPPRSLAGPREE